MTIHDPKPEDTEPAEEAIELPEAEATEAPDAPQEEIPGEPATAPDEDAKPEE